MKTILVDAVGTFVVDGKVDAQMHELLEAYVQPKLILTNANREEAETFGLRDLPYEVFSLSHNPDKTDPAYYLSMMEVNHLKSGELVYFEHSKAAVASAESVGIESYFFDADERDLEKLRDFLNRSLKQT